MSTRTCVRALLCLAGLLPFVRPAQADTLSSLNQLRNYTIDDPTGNTYVAGNIGYIGAYQTEGSLTDSFTDIQGDLVSVQFILVNGFSTSTNFSVVVDGVTLYAAYNISTESFAQPTVSFVGTGSDTLAFVGEDDQDWINVEYPVASEAAPATALPTGAVSQAVALRQVPAAVTPEPSSMVLLGTGLLGVAGLVRRRVGLVARESVR